MRDFTAPAIDPPLPAALPEETSAPKSRPGPALWAVVILSITALAWVSRYPLLSPIYRPLHLNHWRGILECLAALFASVVVHEGGHLTAALFLRFDVTGASIGPVRISRLHGRWWVHFSWRRLFLGSVTATPRSQIKWRQQMLIVVVAGPLATILFVCTLFLLVTSGRVQSDFWEAALQINIELCLLFLVPGPAAAVQVSDTRLILMLLRFDADARCLLLYQVLTQMRIEGRRPRHYPEWIMRRLAIAGARRPMLAAFAHAIADWALDRGDLQTAAAWNEQLAVAAKDCDPKLCYSALAHSACLDLVLHQDVTRAAAKLSRVPFGLLSPRWLRYRSLAVRDLAAGNVAAAAAKLAAAERRWPRPRLPYFEYERMLAAVLRCLSREPALGPAYAAPSLPSPAA